MSIQGVTWHGSKELQALVIDIASLEPFPGNPRRGNVAAIAASLNRFGQTKPVVRDGARLVAGHHVVEAAKLLQWTHIAAVDHQFADEAEQRAFMLADNRTSDVGDYDIAALLEQLNEMVVLDGTGYGDQDLVELQALWDAQQAAFDPNLDPNVGGEQVSQDDLDAAQARLDRQGTGKQVTQILCPNCAHEFFVQ